MRTISKGYALTHSIFRVGGGDWGREDAYTVTVVGQLSRRRGARQCMLHYKTPSGHDYNVS